MQQAQSKYKKEFNKNTASAAEFQVSDIVWLNGQHIKIIGLSWTLDFWYLRSFEIVKVVRESKTAFKLKLPSQQRIYPVFHVSSLNPYQRNKIEGRKQIASVPPETINRELEYKVETILDSKIYRTKLWYLVDWKEYGLEEKTWELAENLENINESINAFYHHHPNWLSWKDLKNSGLRRSSGHMMGDIVMNDSPDNSERTQQGPGGKVEHWDHR